MEGNRNSLGKRYDLIPGEVLDYIAERLAYGAPIHGEENWKKGLPGEKSPVNHALGHLASYQKSRAENKGPLTAEEKDNLQAVLTNLAFEVYFREHPELYDGDNRYNAPVPEELYPRGAYDQGMTDILPYQSTEGIIPPKHYEYVTPPPPPDSSACPTPTLETSTSSPASENPFSKLFKFSTTK